MKQKLKRERGKSKHSSKIVAYSTGNCPTKQRRRLNALLLFEAQLSIGIKREKIDGRETKVDIPYSKEDIAKKRAEILTLKSHLNIKH